MNAEKLVMDWLNAAPELKDYPASFEVPAKSNATNRIPFVTVERTGSTEGRFVSRPLIAVQVWAASRWEASDVAQRLVLHG